MESNSFSSYSGYRKVLTILVGTGILAHVVIILYLVFFAPKDWTDDSMVWHGYRHFVHIGPFFREEAIQSSQHIYAGYFTSGEWKYTDMTDSLVQRYLRNPWKTQLLSVRDRIRESARSLTGKSGWRNSSEFRRLYHYALTHHPEIKAGDSVSLVYVVRWYKPELKKHVPDTLFNLTFEPAE